MHARSILPKDKKKDITFGQTFSRLPDEKVAIRHLLCNLHDEDVQTMRGTVKWFNATKGYGFIAPDGATSDVFVHITEVQKANISNLNQGDVLEFEMAVGKNGRESASNIRKVS